MGSRALTGPVALPPTRQLDQQYDNQLKGVDSLTESSTLWQGVSTFFLDRSHRSLTGGDEAFSSFYSYIDEHCFCGGIHCGVGSRSQTGPENLNHLPQQFHFHLFDRILVLSLITSALFLGTGVASQLWYCWLFFALGRSASRLHCLTLTDWQYSGVGSLRKSKLAWLLHPLHWIISIIFGVGSLHFPLALFYRLLNHCFPAGRSSGQLSDHWPIRPERVAEDALILRLPLPCWNGLIITEAGVVSLICFSLACALLVLVLQLSGVGPLFHSLALCNTIFSIIGGIYMHTVNWRCNAGDNEQRFEFGFHSIGPLLQLLLLLAFAWALELRLQLFQAFQFIFLAQTAHSFLDSFLCQCVNGFWTQLWKQIRLALTRPSAPHKSISQSCKPGPNSRHLHPILFLIWLGLACQTAIMDVGRSEGCIPAMGNAETSPDWTQILQNLPDVKPHGPQPEMCV